MGFDKILEQFKRGPHVTPMWKQRLKHNHENQKCKNGTSLLTTMFKVPIKKRNRMTQSLDFTP